MENKVSVIITTFKRANMLERAINSILDQTYINLEVVVVDDNNPDTEYREKTSEIMNQYSKDNRVKYIKHAFNQNGNVARNTGIENSDGSIICFLDDDDWFEREKIELQVNYLVNNPQYSGVYCGWNRDKKEVIPYKQGDLSFEILSGINLIYTNTIMVWKEAAINCGGWDKRFKRNQEAVFLLRFFGKGYKIGVVPKVLVQFDTSDRSNALDAKKNKEEFEFFLQEHEDTINKCMLRIKEAKAIIYSYRYRGVLLAFLKEKDILGAIKIYIKMIFKMPIRFNKDILKYCISKITKSDLFGDWNVY